MIKNRNNLLRYEKSRIIKQQTKQEDNIPYVSTTQQKSNKRTTEKSKHKKYKLEY
jgi:hypothetical protein